MAHQFTKTTTLNYPERIHRIIMQFGFPPEQDPVGSFKPDRHKSNPKECVSLIDVGEV